MRDEPARQGPTRQGPIPEISPGEIRDLRHESIEVPDGADVTAAPGEGEYAGFFHRTRVNSFQDLQALSLIPEQLREEEVRRAIAADDETALQLARSSARVQADDCDCHGDSDGTVTRRSGGELRRAYNAARKHYHPALAQLHSKASQRNVDWDSPFVVHTKSWVDSIGLARELLVFVVKDLTIGTNATFNVAPGTTGMWLRDIRIHTGGRLVGHSSYLKIRCRSVQGNLA